MKRRGTKQRQWILHKYYKYKSQFHLNPVEFAVAAQSVASLDFVLKHFDPFCMKS